MKYCPYCRRFNPGRPKICHFCGRTWYVRLCPRGHENPLNAQYCGTCGSADLTDAAGHRDWLLIILKGLTWYVAGLLLLCILAGLLNFLRGVEAYYFFSFVIILCLLLIGLRFSLSFLPPPLNRAVHRVGGYIWKLFLGLVRRCLKGIWEIIR